MMAGLLLLWAALGVFLGVFTFIVAERERKRGASRWWLIVLVSS
jgi:hypothetical protein